MRITGEAMVPQGLYGRASEAVSKKAIQACRIIGVILAVVGAFVLVDDAALSANLLLAGGAIGLLIPWGGVRMAVKRGRPALVGPWRYELTDSGMRIENPVGICEMAWSNLLGSADHHDFWLVHTPIKGQSLIVAKAAFSPEDRRAVADVFARLSHRPGQPAAGDRQNAP